MDLQPSSTRDFDFPKIAVESASPSPMGNYAFNFEQPAGAAGGSVDTVVTQDAPSSGGGGGAHTVVVEEGGWNNASPSRVPLLGRARPPPKSWSFLSRIPGNRSHRGGHNNVAAAAATAEDDDTSDHLLQPDGVR